MYNIIKLRKNTYKSLFVISEIRNFKNKINSLLYITDKYDRMMYNFLYYNI